VSEHEDIGSVDEAVQRGATAAGASISARFWASLPPNELTPATFAAIAVSQAAELGMAVDVYDEHELAAGGFRAILAVGQGSAHPPRLVIIDSDPDAKERPFLLVGKGITFDSGGISIKPSADMHQMKGDMGGAAAVLAAITAYQRAGGTRRVVAALPLAENMPGARAQRPGDIVRTWSGKTVEVLNTDAEGRLVLADALAYAIDRFKPTGVIDIATLTGAVSIALGAHAIGMLGTSDELCAALDAAGTTTYERVWRLPLFDEYFEQIKSTVADIQNVGGRPAGTITAAMFLRQFVGDTPWVHLDMAGVDWREKDGPYCPAGPTGAGARLLLAFLLGRQKT
jgi:leucyl aminopeptidase